MKCGGDGWPAEPSGDRRLPRSACWLVDGEGVSSDAGATLCRRSLQVTTLMSLCLLPKFWPRPARTDRCGCRLEAINQYDLGRPSTCSAKKLRIKFVEIGAT